MKTHIHICIFILMLSFGNFNTAQTFEVNGINYNILNATQVEVTSKTGCYDGDVVIPLTINYMSATYNVTAIGYEAFKNCDITSIDLPNSITHIGEYAFRDCRDITSITLPNSVETIGVGAFLYCTKLVSVNIPDMITTINMHTFGQCQDLTSITIPEAVTSIGTYAFSNCNSLTTVNTNVVSPINITIHRFWNLDLSLITLNVPVGSESAYASSPVWQDFGAINGTLSTSALDKNVPIKLFPNPATLNISISGLKENSNYSIYNVVGKSILKGTLLKEEPINIDNLASGLYFLKLKNKEVIKFVKQ